MKPVVIYTRISSDRDNLRAGVDRQAEDCSQYAEQHQLKVIDVIEDNNTSAYSRKSRPGWKRVLELVRTKQVEGIIVWHTDRLYRHPSDLEEIIELVTDLNLTIYTVTAGELDLNTATGRMVARLLGSVARNEVEHKAERQSRAHLELARRGGWSGGPIPIGYRKVEGTTGQLEIEPTVAGFLQQAADRIIAGRSLRATAEWYQSEVGRTTRPGVLKLALTGPTIAGLRMHIPQGHRDKWAAARSRRTVSGDLPMQFDTYEAQWPAILDHDRWTAVRAILLDPARRGSGRRPEKSLLSGIIVCHCGTKMGYSKHSYKCAVSMNGCGAVSVGTKGLHKLILNTVSARVAATENLTFEVPVAPVEPTELETLTDRRRVFLSLFGEGQISQSELSEQLSKLDGQIQSIAASRSQVRLASARQQNVIEGLAAWETIRSNLEADPESVEFVAAARTVIAALIAQVVVKPSVLGKKHGSKPDHDRIGIEWSHAASK